MNKFDESGNGRRPAWGLLAVLAGAMVVLSQVGCNTTEGVGKDLESAGEGIKDAANDAKD